MQQFSRKTLEFLVENRLNDSRDWYMEHKGEYEQFVYEPLRCLVTALTPAMLKIDPEFVVAPSVGRTISRIRRDTRFSHDKSLYRENMWVVFKRGKMHGALIPGIYVDISANGLEYGCGFYHAPPAVMESIRQMILSDSPEFKRAQKAYEKQSVYQMEGDCYRRERFPGQPPAVQQWLNRKTICFSAYSQDFDLLFSERLPQKLTQDLQQLKPIYDFLKEACRRASTPEEP